MNTTILLVANQSSEFAKSTSYIVGAVIALFILGYLLYSLVKPEKF